MIEIVLILPHVLRAPLSKGTECAGWLEMVGEQVSTLRFGVVQIVVHDGRVVQIERTEKVRLDRPPGHETEPESRNAYRAAGGANNSTR